MSDFTGRVLGPYKLEQQLGKGGMATVFRAYQTTVKRYVAVKVMSPEIASDPGFVERFTREAELIAALQHPHILPVIDYGESGGTHYLVMRYIESGSLDDLLRRKQLSFEETSRLLGQIASALDYAHKKGVIHRDFKPNNVLLDSDGNAYLTDFGIARLANSERNLTMTGAIMGTPAYMSPEQGMGKTVDARADLYSLGVVLYEMVVGRLPFTGDTPASLIFQHAFQPPAPPQQYRPDVPMSVVNVISRALAKEPDDRFQSGEEMVRAFNEATGRRYAGDQGENAPGPEDNDQATFVGDAPPRKSPTSVRSTPPPPLATTPPSRISTPPVAPTPPAMMASSAEAQRGGPPPSGGQVPGGQGGGGASYPPPVATPPPAQPPGRGTPILLIFGIVAVIALVLGIGGVVVVNTNNTNATNEGLTRVAMIALSATKTATATPTASDTPTITLTPTITPSPTETLTPTATLTATPNLTGTAISERLTALAQFEANGTATAAAQIAATFTQQANFASTAIALITRTVERRATDVAATATLNAQASEAAQVAATQTQDAQNNADLQSTATIVAANLRSTSVSSTASARIAQTATARSRATATKTATTPPTSAPTEPVNANLGKYANGTPDQVIARLGQDGILNNTEGLLQVGPLVGDIDPVDTPNYYRWRMLGTYNFTNFVASAEFSWKDAGSNGECGFLSRYSQPTASTFRFYVFTVSVANTYRVITYKDTSDQLTKRGTTLNAQTADGDLNHILLIGEGSRFRMFLNGEQVTDVTLPDFESGTVAIMAATLSDTGIACSFKNAWVYELTGNSNQTNKGDLLSDKPEDVIKALEVSNTIPVGSATVAAQDSAATLTSKAGDSLVFYRLEVPGSPSVKSFVLSTDVTWNFKTADTLCGVHFFGTRGPSNLMAFEMSPNSEYLLEAYVLEEWQPNPIAKGTDPVINGDNGAVNRVTVVVTGGKATIFVNGKKLIEQPSLPLSRGNAGYFLSLGKTPDIEGCSFSNTTLWTLTQ